MQLIRNMERMKVDVLKMHRQTDGAPPPPPPRRRVTQRQRNRTSETSAYPLSVSLTAGCCSAITPSPRSIYPKNSLWSQTRGSCFWGWSLEKKKRDRAVKLIEDQIYNPIISERGEPRPLGLGSVLFREQARTQSPRVIILLVPRGLSKGKSG